MVHLKHLRIYYILILKVYLMKFVESPICIIKFNNTSICKRINPSQIFELKPKDKTVCVRLCAKFRGNLKYKFLKIFLHNIFYLGSKNDQ